MRFSGTAFSVSPTRPPFWSSWRNRRTASCKTASSEGNSPLSTFWRTKLRRSSVRETFIGQILLGMTEGPHDPAYRKWPSLGKTGPLAWWSRCLIRAVVKHQKIGRGRGRDELIDRQACEATSVHGGFPWLTAAEVVMTCPGDPVPPATNRSARRSLTLQGAARGVRLQRAVPRDGQLPGGLGLRRADAVLPGAVPRGGAERAAPARRYCGAARGWAVAWTLAVVVAPVGLLLHRGFVEGYLVPILAEAGVPRLRAQP